MGNVLNIVVKVFTVLTILVCFSLTGWSFITGQPVLLTVVGSMLTVGFGYFIFRDIKKILEK